MKLQNIPLGAWVFVGGGSGALLRTILLLIFPYDGNFPWGVLAINCLGAWGLGFLLSFLAVFDQDAPGTCAQPLRLGLGTGFLGGFTTYSAFAAGLAEMVASNQVLAASLYAALSFIGGFALCCCGVWAGSGCANSTRVQRVARRFGLSNGEPGGGWL